MFYDELMFKRLTPYLEYSKYRGTRGNHHGAIELRRMPSDLLAEALAWEAPCVTCGKPMHPVRLRRGVALNPRTTINGAYVAAACSLADSIGCCRGKDATEAYDAIAGLVRDKELVLV